jgi:hypothetical protein
MHLRAQVIPALEAPWCTTLALVGNNPEVEVPDYLSSRSHPLPPRFRLSRRLQLQSALVNRGEALSFISRSATCRAPVLVARAYTGIPTDELFVTIEACFPERGVIKDPRLNLIGGHIIRVLIPIAPATIPTCFSVQRWGCRLSAVGRVLSATGLRACQNPTLSSDQFLNSRPNTNLFCDWQVVLGIIQEAYPNFPRRINQVAFRDIPRLPSFFSRRHNIYGEDLLVPQDLVFRTFVVDTARELLAWSEAPIDILSDVTCGIVDSDLVRPASGDPSLIPPPSARSDLVSQ